MVRVLKVCLAVLILASAGHAGQPQATAPGGEPCDGVVVPIASSNSGVCIKPGSGESFKDCPECPEMVVVSAGSFTMGSPADEPDRERGGRPDVRQWDTLEGPQHRVTISRPFAVSKYAVTFAEWDACVADGGCDAYKPVDGDTFRGAYVPGYGREDQQPPGWGRGDRPVIWVNWHRAKSYVKWMSQKTGKRYRLLSEAERECVTRAETTTPFWWGRSITTEQANYIGQYIYAGGGHKGEYRNKLH
jgi:formylglycine-generating enzyme required for sulfatase activity